MTTQVPHGTVTFLFTDLERSTEHWESDAASMTTELERHDRIARSAFSRHQGHVFATGGDGFCVAFADALAAVDAAIEMQSELGAVSELRVRMGLNSGVAVERDGDYFGPVVIRAARVMGSGHGGQILMTSVTAELTSGHHTTKDLGEHRLKGLTGPVHLHQLVHAALPDEPRLPRTEGLSSGNLPNPASSFVGREREVALLQEAIRAHRLVTLIGVGGTGKTRLAVETGHTLTSEFVDGVWLIELAPVDDEVGVEERFLEALGIGVAPSVTHLDRLVDMLAAKRLLLVVDNCEHVLDTAARVVARVLADTPSVHVCTTSREPLLVDGEHVVGVPSLSTNAGVESESVHLFLERAIDAGATIDQRPASLEVVGDICRRLDGMPLAIELAASRTRTMPLLAIRDRLDERFRLLKGGRRSSTERHQTLRATVDWSYRLLDEAEQATFDRLAVFAGPFTLEEACAICADDGLDEFDVVDAIQSLVDKSMVACDTARTRPYRLLETMRAFGHEALDASGRSDATRQRHAEFFGGRSQRITEECFGPGEAQAVRDYREALAEMRSAVLWAAHAGEFATVEDFLPAMHVLGWAGVLEPQSWLREIDDLVPRTPVITSALIHEALFNRADLARAERLAAFALTMPNNRAALYAAYRALGLVSLLRDRNVDRAIDYFRQERDASLSSPIWYEPLLGGFVLELNLVIALRPSEGIGDEMIRDGERRGWPSGIGLGHYLVGRSKEMTRPAEARASYSRAAALARQVGNDALWCWATRERCVLAIDAGLTPSARAELHEVLRIHHDNGFGLDMLVSLGCFVIDLDQHSYHRQAAMVLGHIDGRGRPTGAAAEAFDSALARVRDAVADDWDELTALGRTLTSREIAELVEETLADSASTDEAAVSRVRGR